MPNTNENKTNELNTKAVLSKGWVVCIAALFCCLLWGSAFPCVKIGYQLFQIDSKDTASQILFAGCRFALAGILTILFGSISSGKFLRPAKGNWKRVAILSCFQTIIQYVFFYSGLSVASGVSSSIINGSGTFFAILIATLILKQEKMTVSKMTGCILGFAGVILVSFASGNGSSDIGFVWNGEGFILIASFCYALSSILIKNYGKYENPVVLSGYQFFIGGTVMAILAFIFGGHFQINDIKGIILLLYMAFISAAAYSLWGILLKHNPVSKVAVYGFGIPVFGVLLSVLFLGELNNLNLFYIIALILVSAGIYLVNMRKGV